MRKTFIKILQAKIKTIKIFGGTMSDKKIFIIAEIGSNHNGSLKLAKKLIVAAKNCGCDSVKFQSWDETLNSDLVYKKIKILKEYLKYKLNFKKLKF